MKYLVFRMDHDPISSHIGNIRETIDLPSYRMATNLEFPVKYN